MKHDAFEIILPFLAPIAELIRDSGVSEIMVNSSGDACHVFAERAGRLNEVEGVAIAEEHLQVACKCIARTIGKEISEEQPILDGRLPDGSRVAAMFQPCSVEGTTLTIRKFDSRRFTFDELIELGTLTPEVGAALRESVAARKNILISGGTGTGKTTLLNAIAGLIPEDERIITIEDTAEIQLRHRNLRRFEARGEQPGLPAVTMGELLRAALRHRPDRIILGEVRGKEAFDLLQALNTGHSGSLSTIHADSAAMALSRFTNCVLESRVDLPFIALRRSIADAVHVLVHIERKRATGERVVSQVLCITGFDPVSDRYSLEPIRGQ